MLDNYTFKKFRSLNFPKSVIGLEWSGNDTAYFCTPIGAKIIGCLGVDGIHFCFIPSISGDMAFVVSPVACGQNYVEPIANTFEEFLSFVSFCKDASPLEQISYINDKQFLELLKSEEIVKNLEKETALKVLSESLNISPNLDTYRCVKSLQENFDHSIIPFSKEYYSTLEI